VTPGFSLNAREVFDEQAPDRSERRWQAGHRRQAMNKVFIE